MLNDEDDSTKDDRASPEASELGAGRESGAVSAVDVRTGLKTVVAMTEG